MRIVTRIFVVLLLCSLTSFIEKDKPNRGLSVGDQAPAFVAGLSSDGQPFRLDDWKGKYVLLSFWASYDAPSRMQNVRLSQALHGSLPKDVKMVSVSFDQYKSVFDETIRKDRIPVADCFLEAEGESSGLFRTYRLDRGFQNFLLNDKGVIVAKNISAAELSSYLV